MDRVRSSGVLIAVTAAFVAVYLALDANKLFALRYGVDTGTILQFLTGEIHGNGSWNAAEGRPHLQVHDSWALLVLVPILAVFPFAQTLLVLQVVAVAAAAIPLARFARRCGADAWGANAVGIAYLLSPSAQGFAYGDVLENSFVPLVACIAANAVRARQLFATLACAELLMGLKEDQILFVLWFGVACGLWWDRRMGIALVALGLINAAGFFLVEHAAHALPSIPHYGLAIAHPFDKLTFFAAVLAPFAFAPLWLGYRALLALPLVAELAFNGRWAYEIARVGTHWTTSIVAAAALGAAVVVAERPRFARPMIICAVLCAVLINDTVLKLGRWPYVVDGAAYARAVALREGTQRVVLPRSAEGIYAVAAANPLVGIERAPAVGTCPSYNTDARAWLASLHLAPPEAGVRICEGAAVRSTLAGPSAGDRSVRAPGDR